MSGAASYRRHSTLDFDFDGFVAIGFHSGGVEIVAQNFKFEFFAFRPADDQGNKMFAPSSQRVTLPIDHCSLSPQG